MISVFDTGLDISNRENNVEPQKERLETSPRSLDIPADAGGQEQEIDIDDNIIAVLPVGSRFLSAHAYETSKWTQTARVNILTGTNEQTSFFLKTSAGDLGQTMFRGEFESMKAIHDILPEASPRPVAWGRCRREPDAFFFLAEFVNMDSKRENVPDATVLCQTLAEMHRKGVNPAGKFGFPVTTCNGNIPQENTWRDSWEAFFSNGLRYMLDLDSKANGEQPELIAAFQPIFDLVIPRLLRPLEQGPNKIRPTLVHGDLWCGNCSTNLDTGAPVIFDASAFYAHNEYELGNWRAPRNNLNKEHIDAYRKEYPPAQPVEEFEDRIMLYELRFSLHYCIMVAGLKDVKQEMIGNMRYLAEKYS